MIEWLNQNQGFVMALLTFGSFITAVFLAYIALRTVKISGEAKEISKDAKEISNKALEISEKHLKLVADLENQRSRPYVLFNLYNDTGKTYATVKNYGLTSANDIKISVEPKLLRASIDESESILTSQTIYFLPPDFEIKDTLGLSSDFYQKHEEAKFKVKISYKDSFANEFENDFYIDLEILKRRSYTKEVSAKEIVEELKEINKSLKNFTRESSSKSQDIEL